MANANTSRAAAAAAARLGVEQGGIGGEGSLGEDSCGCTNSCRTTREDQSEDNVNNWPEGGQLGLQRQLKDSEGGPKNEDSVNSIVPVDSCTSGDSCCGSWGGGHWRVKQRQQHIWRVAEQLSLNGRLKNCFSYFSRFYNNNKTSQEAGGSE